MKFIKFCGEVLKVPESVTFWVQDRGPDYSAPYVVNMSPLEIQNYMGEPSLDTIIRGECYETNAEAFERLNELLHLLNS
jgi:hypothetical protein